MKPIILSLLGFGLCAALLTHPLDADEAAMDANHSGTPRPNILLVLVDDLGFSDLGCYGSEIETPRIHALAKRGMRFTQFYNTGRCWPTRASLLSGFYAQQVRRDRLPDLSLGGVGAKRPAWATLLPKMLSTVGYQSYHTGKWHIDGTPPQAGFDRSALDQGRYFAPPRSGADRTGAARRGERPDSDSQDKKDDFYLTTAMADDVISVLDEHVRDHPDQPFFQYLAFTAPHFPLHAKPEDIEVYRGRYDAGWDVVRQQRFEKMVSIGVLGSFSEELLSKPERDLGPPYHFPDAIKILGNGEVNRPLPWSQLTEPQKRFQASKMEIHAAMVHRIDIELGRVLDKIEALGQTENTMVVFLSDNGASAEIMVRGDGHDPNAAMGSASTYLCLGPGWSTVANTPFRRHKTWTHEGGIATPAIISWPAQMPNGGKTSNRVSHVIDLVPTLLEITGAERPAASGHEKGPQLPGKSFAGLIRQDPHEGDDQNFVSETDRALWWFHDGHRAIRVGDFKAVKPIAEPWELYDLSVDRGEQHELAIVQNEQLDSMTRQWERMADEMRRDATEDLDADETKPLSERRSGTMDSAQEAARPKRVQALIQNSGARIGVDLCRGTPCVHHGTPTERIGHGSSLGVLCTDAFPVPGSKRSAAASIFTGCRNRNRWNRCG